MARGEGVPVLVDRTATPSRAGTALDGLRRYVAASLAARSQRRVCPALIVEVNVGAMFAARIRLVVEAMSALLTEYFSLGMHRPLRAC
jgi:hypothetical protein